eukprot:CAMPEP_0203760348 /NCGR_PEP_ID=MMETSP0098-20131031/13663_1 /ASSEMBLY_ACC=CAM_ASM_000208 /TAXON_ID=96639 /ORGANISM=" , Strain NY0313808BC1" /LENGTH=248 /DNA_ID=CAMNT_0050653869 /DNA_START=389 /DNA_END=1133 /DNA_ORIENTATION=+
MDGIIHSPFRATAPEKNYVLSPIRSTEESRILLSPVKPSFTIDSGGDSNSSVATQSWSPFLVRTGGDHYEKHKTPENSHTLDETIELSREEASSLVSALHEKQNDALVERRNLVLKSLEPVPELKLSGSETLVLPKCISKLDTIEEKKQKLDVGYQECLGDGKPLKPFKMEGRQRTTAIKGLNRRVKTRTLKRSDVKRRRLYSFEPAPPKLCPGILDTRKVLGTHKDQYLHILKTQTWSFLDDGGDAL